MAIAVSVFGGLSPDTRKAAATGCDVFPMWPDKENVAAITPGGECVSPD